MEYDVNTASIKLSVRELCALALGRGDLEYGGGRATWARAQLGADIHRRLQSERTGRYQPEVSLSATCRLGELTYTVSGRADGVEQGEDGTYTVEEIKTKRGYGYGAPVPEQEMAQLYCYGYFLCASRALTGVHLCMIVVDTEHDRRRRTSAWKTAEELRAYYLSLLARIERWALLLYEHTLRELPKLASLPFPYSGMRLGQEDLIRAVWRAVRRRKRLFSQAPTGIGKTMSTLYPAIRARGAGECDRIFYLTAKASTRHEAIAACRRLVEYGAPLRAVVLTAREQTCPNAAASCDGRSLSSHCNSIECERAHGYYDRVGDAVYELLMTGRCYDRARIEAIAAKYCVCPYELSLDLSEHCDIIIADYNYAFDPLVYLRRYFAAGAVCEGRNVFLIDEAHNLADRARDMYSATLCRRDFEAVYQRAHPHDRVLREGLETIIRDMMSMRRLCHENLEKDENGQDAGYFFSHTPLFEFHEKLAWFSDQCTSWLRAHREEEIAPAVSDLLYSIKEFLCIADHYDEHYVTYLELASGDAKLQLLCLDPSHELDILMNRAISSVLFSATLMPPDYYVDVLGGGEEAERLWLSSPYERENFGLYAVEGVSTRYSERKRSAREIAACIGAAVSGKKGNYIVYFPSYSYLKTVLTYFRALYPKTTVVVQTKGMRAAEREAFLDAFKADRDVLRVGFCVLGGSFSEGVDLPGSRLIGSIIVGVGLPGLSGERNILQEYYQNKCELGHEYAYVFPGMVRVLQAAGRVIRREDDRGIVVLLDDRYATPAYTRLFPNHWSHVRYARNAQKLADLVTCFWQSEPSSEENQEKK